MQWHLRWFRQRVDLISTGAATGTARLALRRPTQQHGNVHQRTCRVCLTPPTSEIYVYVYLYNDNTYK